MPLVTYTAGPFFVINPTPVIEVDVGPECDNPVQPCDDFALTTNLPAGYAAAHPTASIKVTASWTPTGNSGKADTIFTFTGIPETTASRTIALSQVEGRRPTFNLRAALIPRSQRSLSLTARRSIPSS